MHSILYARGFALSPLSIQGHEDRREGTLDPMATYYMGATTTDNCRQHGDMCLERYVIDCIWTIILNDSSFRWQCAQVNPQHSITFSVKYLHISHIVDAGMWSFQLLHGHWCRTNIAALRSTASVTIAAYLQRHNTSSILFRLFS